VRHAAHLREVCSGFNGLWAGFGYGYFDAGGR
jgi:hypothetical protein